MNELDVNQEKELIFVEGVITYFDCSGEGKPTLFFEGYNVEDEDERELIKRRIKVTKYADGYKVGSDSPLLRADYPKIDHKYKAKLQLETWVWEDHNCMRVTAFQIIEDLGINDKYSEKVNPFKE